MKDRASDLSLAAALVMMGEVQLDTVSLSISVGDCASRLPQTVRSHLYDRIRSFAEHLAESTSLVTTRFGLRLPRLCITLTPILRIAAAHRSDDFARLAEIMEAAAHDVGVDYVAGLCAFLPEDPDLDGESLFSALAPIIRSTERVGAVINCTSSTFGISTAAVNGLARSLLDLSTVPASANGPGDRLVIGSNLDPSRWMHDGMLHYTGEARATINLSMHAPFSDTVAPSQQSERGTSGEYGERFRRLGARLSSAGRAVARRICAELEQFGGPAVVPGYAPVLAGYDGGFGPSEPPGARPLSRTAPRSVMERRFIQENLARGAAVVAGPPPCVYGSAVSETAMVVGLPEGDTDAITSWLADLLLASPQSSWARTFSTGPRSGSPGSDANARPGRAAFSESPGDLSASPLRRGERLPL